MPSRPNRRWAAGCIVVGVITLGLAVWSVADAGTRLAEPVQFRGARGFSSSWNAPPLGDDATWYVSRGLVAPPPEDSSRAQLREWLAREYPVLSAGAALESDDSAFASKSGSGPVLDLGGGPPRRLYVEPGEGLVMRLPAVP